MILKVEDLKDTAAKILTAVDSSESSIVNETLELKVERKVLYMNVTNREYFVQCKFNLGIEEDFHATVNANVFLKLISQLTSETVEFTIVDNTLIVNGNGKYKLPLIFDGDKLLKLPEIKIKNKTAEFNISSNILHSILTYNSKELLKDTVMKPVQKLYYMDEHGAITFTTGACVNNFELPQPVKILLTPKVVKLFKLFNTDEVKFTLGYDSLSESIIQTKVQFSNDTISVTAILSCDDSLLNSVPVDAIRSRAMNEYEYGVSLNKNELLSIINRLVMFTSTSSTDFYRTYSTFIFTPDKCIIKNDTNDYTEEILYTTPLNITNEYSATLDLKDIKLIVENCNEQYINLYFGNHQAFTFVRGNIYNIIPEVVR